MKDFIKTYFKIGLVAGPMCLWIDSCMDEDDRIMKESHTDDLSSRTNQLINAGCGLVVGIAEWPSYAVSLLVDFIFNH